MADAECGAGVACAPSAHEFLECTFMMIPFRAAAAGGRIDCEPASGGISTLDFDSDKDLHHEMGNSGGRGFPLRHGNHDVHRQSIANR
jgi:hypothetical protein